MTYAARHRVMPLPSHRVLVALAPLALLPLIACPSVRPSALPKRPVVHEVPHAAASVGMIEPGRALLWAYVPGAEKVTVRWHAEDGPEQQVEAVPDKAHDETIHLRLEGLGPSRSYRYELTVHGPKTEVLEGEFHTPPAPDQSPPLRFAWGGDLAGQNVCRDLQEGFPIFAAIAALDLDFFIGLGDMAYSDDPCQEFGFYGNRQMPGGFGPAVDLESYRQHWRYARADAHARALLSRAAYVPVWDDHEVLNDFGPENDTRSDAPYTAGVHLLPIGRQVFEEHNPIELGQHRFHRSFRWGQHLEVFVLDTRQYRSDSAEPDRPEARKSMLGREQRQWIERAVSSSEATWKVIVSSVPISVPTGPGDRARDGWASGEGETGYERELDEILRAFAKAKVENIIFITTDVHFASVLRYSPFEDKPGFLFHEVITGPLHAGLFPKLDLDRSFGPERIFFFGPESAAGLDYDSARRWFNFGLIEIDPAGHLSLSVRDVDGTPWFSAKLSPQGQ